MIRNLHESINALKAICSLLLSVGAEDGAEIDHDEMTGAGLILENIIDDLKAYAERSTAQ